LHHRAVESNFQTLILKSLTRELMT